VQELRASLGQSAASVIDKFKTNGHIEGMPRPSVKEEIVQAALKVLHQRGFNATGVQDITDAAGVPKGSFYNHFESKEALGVEALERYWQGALNSLAELKDETVPPIERLKRYFRRLNELGRKLKYRQGCMVGNLSVEMSDQSPIMRERLAVILATWSRAIGACVKEAQEDGSMRRDLEPTVVAAFMLNSWEGTVMRAKVDRSSVPFDQFEKVVFTSLASGD
jgi:TetR/AcrR family transcriptional regulator, transcriptional repressor for nem operon